MTSTVIYPDGASCRVHWKRTEAGLIRVEWKTAVMSACAFAYFKTEAEASAFKRGFEFSHYGRKATK